MAAQGPRAALIERLPKFGPLWTTVHPWLQKRREQNRQWPSMQKTAWQKADRSSMGNSCRTYQANTCKNWRIPGTGSSWSLLGGLLFQEERKDKVQVWFVQTSADRFVYFFGVFSHAPLHWFIHVFCCKSSLPLGCQVSHRRSGQTTNRQTGQGHSRCCKPHKPGEINIGKWFLNVLMYACT